MKITQFTTKTKGNQTGTVLINDPVEWKAILDQARQKLAANLKIPGFRPGKVPLDVLTKHLDDNKVLLKAQEIAIHKAYDFVLQKHKTALTGFRYQKTTLNQLTFTNFQVTFEWQKLPTIVLGAYKKLAIDQPTITISEPAVEQQIQQLQKAQAEYIQKSTTKLEKGDFIVIDYQTTFETKPVPSASLKDFQVELGKTNFLPAFETELYKLKPQVKHTFSLAYPTKYYNSDLAGKTVTHDVTLKKIQQQILPKITKLITDFKLKVDEAGFRKLIKQQLHNQKIKNLQPQVLKTVKSAILKTATAEISKEYLDIEFDSMKKNFIKRLQEEKRTLADYLKEKNQTEVNFDQDFRKVIEGNIKELLMIFEVAKKENIAVSEKELTDYYKRLITQTKETLAEAQKKYPKFILHNYLLRMKVEDFLLKENWTTANFDLKG